MSGKNTKAQWVRADSGSNSTDHLDDETKRKVKHGEQAVASAQAAGDRREEGIALVELGDVYFFQAQLPQAIELYQQALSIFQEVGDHSAAANTLRQLATAYTPLAPDRAIQCHTQALTIYRAAGDLSGEQQQLNGLGLLYLGLGQAKLAQEYSRQALAVSRTLGDRTKEANALNSLGVACFMAGQLQPAIDYCEQAVTVARANNDGEKEMNALYNMGTFYFTSNQQKRAFGCFEQALAISRDTGDRNKEARILFEMGKIYSASKQNEKAIEVTQAAVNIFDETGGPGADQAREQLNHLLTRKSRNPLYAVLVALGLLLTIGVAAISILNQKAGSGSNVVAPAPVTGVLRGMILNKNREPLVNTRADEVGIIMALCVRAEPDAECLNKSDLDSDLSALLSSICASGDTKKTCQYHWGRTAAPIRVDGSYVFDNLLPGEYDLALVIISSGLATIVELKNVEPVRAGRITRYDFVTK